MDDTRPAVLESHRLSNLHTPFTSVCGMITNTDASGYAVAKVKGSIHTVYHGAAWWAMLFVAFALLTVCALLAGLTLAICGLEMVSLQMRSVSGTEKEKYECSYHLRSILTKERQQALVIARMKRHSTWMLCSLIICSVACSEYFPFVIQGLCQVHDEWAAVIISTLLLAVFAELIPQWLIPRNAIAWGYYCWPLIWGCMWLTSTVSYPLSWFLDSLTTRKDDFSIFTNEQLAIIIKNHERSERRGGLLDADTTRILLGALGNEGRKIGGSSKVPALGSVPSDKDIEKANTAIKDGIIVKWSAVRYVGIDEVVDSLFLQKITSWSYSRIPVIGECRINQGHSGKPNSNWGKGKRVFGYFHIRNLIGNLTQMQAKPGSPQILLVRDLPIYPLPIVREDMSVYQLLNMFQLGMSRIALVIPMTTLSSISPGRPIAETILGTPAAKEDDRIMSQPGLAAHTSWPADYLSDAQASLERQEKSRRCTGGISAPEPTGIITFHDVVDAILQKTSQDEKHIFSLDSEAPCAMIRNTGSQLPVSSIRATAGLDACIPTTMRQPLYRGNLRNRKASEFSRIGGADGADERCLDSMNTVFHCAKSQSAHEDLSYTQDSQGGFHNCCCSTLFDKEKAIGSKGDASFGFAFSFDYPEGFGPSSRTVSLTPHQEGQTVYLRGQRTLTPWPHFSAVGKPYQVLEQSSCEQRSYAQERDSLIHPIPSKKQKSHQSFRVGTNADLTSDERIGMRGPVSKGGQAHLCNSNFGPASPNSWYRNKLDHDEYTTQVFDLKQVPALAQNPDTVHDVVHMQEETLGVTQDAQTDSDDDGLTISVKPPYDGFPPDLLDKKMQAGTRTYMSMTIPRMSMGLNREILGRENSFHDDRALLPSQKQMLRQEANLRVARITSL